MKSISAIVIATAIWACAAVRAEPIAQRAEFPEIRDWNSLRMVLEETPGFWGGRAYRVEISGDGSVWYEGGFGAAAKGPIPVKISRDIVEDLFEQFRRADFFNLRDAYVAEISDIGDYYITLSFDSRTKRVRDHMGVLAGMPPSVVEIEQTIKSLPEVRPLIEGYQ